MINLRNCTVDIKNGSVKNIFLDNHSNDYFFQYVKMTTIALGKYYEDNIEPLKFINKFPSGTILELNVKVIEGVPSFFPAVAIHSRGFKYTMTVGTIQLYHGVFVYSAIRTTLLPAPYASNYKNYEVEVERRVSKCMADAYLRNNKLISHDLILDPDANFTREWMGINTDIEKKCLGNVYNSCPPCVSD